MFKKLLFLMASVVLLGMVLTNTANAADPDLAAYWSLDDGSGTIAVDASGNDKDGVLQGNLQWVAGTIDGALHFDGSSNVKAPHIALDNRSFSIAMWINPEVFPGGNVCVAGQTKDDSTTGSSLVLHCRVAPSLRMGFYGNDLAGPGGMTPINTWTHVAFVYELDTAKRIYVNGVNVAEGSPNPLLTDSGSLFLGSRLPGGHEEPYTGLMDDVQVYHRALTEQEIPAIMLGLGLTDKTKAALPSPADETTDVDRDVVLGWSPSEFAATHDVYFGTNFDDVNNADRTNPLDVLVSQAQAPESYDPDRLQLETTYYWRIDEVNAAPDNTIFKGDTWSFIVEPVAYPIQGVAVTASSAAAGAEANNTINESGLTDDLHSTDSAAMWLSESDPAGASVQYEFDKAYKLHELWVWNHNTLYESLLGYGAKNVTIETSTDANNWTALGDFEFARADGTNTYAHNTTIDLDGVMAQYVRLNIKDNWGGLVPQYGLSEVRFSYTPVSARYPVPADGQTDLPLDVALDWRAGREAVQHKVYLGADEQAVADSSDEVLIATVDKSEYTVNGLGLGETYYWKIDEVNEAETPATRQGDIWNFSTQEYLVVDDFESYNDIPVGEQDSSLVYMTWADGFENPTNGSTMGYFEAFQPTMETSIVQDGKQSVPFYYDNTVAGHSEATAKIADLAIGQDWTKSGIKSLSLWFYGDPNNAAEQMYVKLNGSKVLYDGDAANLASTTWQPWNIELADFGVNLGSVTEISIGFERSGATGGAGMVLLDALRLYSYDRQLITPAEPDQAALVGHWKFDEGSGTTALDSSGNNNTGAITGAEWVAGKVGGALNFKGAEYVVIPPASWSSIERQVTVAFWAYGDPAVQPQDDTIFSAYQGTDTRVASCHLPWSSGTVYWDTGGDATGYDRISKGATPGEYEGSWQHWAFVKDADTGVQSIYLNGVLWHSGTDNARAMTGVTVFTIGSRADLTQNYAGMIDDFRLYNSVLSEEELAWLGGRTKPYDKPF